MSKLDAMSPAERDNMVHEQAASLARNYRPGPRQAQMMKPRKPTVRFTNGKWRFYDRELVVCFNGDLDVLMNWIYNVGA